MLIWCSFEIDEVKYPLSGMLQARSVPDFGVIQTLEYLNRISGEISLL